jgi:hypothetical protein
MMSRTLYNTIVSTYFNTMNNSITANDLKTKGISIVSPFAEKGLETFIKVRGVDKYVVITVDEFNRLRECELTAALVESEQDLENGNFQKGSVEEHMERILN